MGAHVYDKDDDYPDFAYTAAQKVAEDSANNRAILICGSGAGVAITANKVKGVYCAQVWSAELARGAREHDGVNAIAIGARYIDESTALQCVEEFLKSEGANAKRHRRRFQKVQKIELSNT